MIIPQNGKVVILDDNIDQASPLIDVLSRNKIPFTYHSDKVELLPQEGNPYEDIRILFLDINLSASGTPEETIKSQLQRTLLRMIKPNTPYLALVWSLKENEYEELIKKMFEEGIPEIQPIGLIPIQKSDFFQLEVSDQTPSEMAYVLRNDINVIEELEKRISEAIGAMDALEAIILWENLVNEASSSVINEVFSMVSTKEDPNSRIKGILYKLAEAMYGRQLSTNSADEIVKKGLSILNNLLIDDIELKMLETKPFNLIKDISNPSEFVNQDRALLNTKILLNMASQNEVYPGNIYAAEEVEMKDFPFKGLIADLLNIPVAVRQFYEERKGELPPIDFNPGDYKNENKKEYSKYEKEIRAALNKNSVFVWVELSPVCDYAQKKWKTHRVCPGMLWREEDEILISSSDSLYKSPSIVFNEEIFKLIMDFRYFSSYPTDRFAERESVFSLRQPILVDIQSMLARHVNRPGISALI